MSNFDYQQQQDVRPLLCLIMFGSVERCELDPSCQCPPLSKYLIKLDEIAFDGVRFCLNNPIEVELYQEDGLWYSEFEPLGILASGKTKEQAMLSFYQDFSVLWQEIAQCPDDDLTVDALKIKRNFLSLVKR